MSDLADERQQLETLQAEAKRLRAELANPPSRPSELVKLESDNIERLRRCMELREVLRRRDAGEDELPISPELGALPRSLRTVGLAGAIIAFMAADAASRLPWFTPWTTPIAFVALGVPLIVNAVRVARSARKNARR